MEEVRNNGDKQRYELPVDHGVAVAAYEREGGAIVFTHTVVPREARGQGIASRLIGAALADVRAQGLRVVPLCPFVQRFVAAHAEYADLVGDRPA